MLVVFIFLLVTLKLKIKPDCIIDIKGNVYAGSSDLIHCLIVLVACV